MPQVPYQESDALKEARSKWLAAIEQYNQEVGLYTEPINSPRTERASQDISRVTELMESIKFWRDKYDEALGDDGRPVPHRPVG